MKVIIKIINLRLLLGLTAFVVTILQAVQETNSQADFDVQENSLTVKQKPINYRLPSTMTPISYKLYLHPDLSSGNFSGQVAINVHVDLPTKQIVLHSHKLTINTVSVVQSASGKNLAIKNYSLDTVRQFLIIDMAEGLRFNTYIKVVITFEGNMLNKLEGLYKSTYTLPTKEIRNLVASQLEATHAREAFPCFDEPALKANFEITLVHPSDGKYHALSNMNALSSKNLGEYTETRFNNSVKMSTYLACFLVSDYAYKTKTVNTKGIGKNFDIRVFTAEHKIDSVDFALEAGVAIMEHFIQYFNIEYPLNKLDMAAIPDFKSGAMENWGLITYRESTLLYDESISSTANKQSIVKTVAHELAHMWFGNLVTVRWWNDLWLNEGFANYFENKGVQAAYPTWQMSDQFLINTLHRVMRDDASIYSTPIVQIVETPADISENFSSINYKKGGSVLRMLENIVGSKKFKQAVRNYLNKFKYRNAETNDFLTEVAATKLNFDVKLMMRTWTEQMGYPVVEVKRVSDGLFNITQKRFLSNIDDYNLAFDDSPFNYKWMIPLTYVTNEQDTYGPLWFDFDKPSVEISVPTSVKWIKLNKKQVGFYRVNYERDHWRRIITDLNQKPFTAFGIADRAHLLDDAFALADAAQLDYSIALDMTVYLENEPDYLPWHVAAQQFKGLQRRLSSSEFHGDFLRYAQQLLSKIYTEVGWTVDKDNHLRSRLRVTVLSAACALGHPDCLNEAVLRFNAWLSNPTAKPSPDLRIIVYYYGMQRVNTEEAWEQIWQLMVNEQDASEKLTLMYGLSAVRLPHLLQRYVELAGNEKFVRRQDYFTCLQDIASNPIGQSVVWDYVQKHWSDLNNRDFNKIIKKITKHFDSQNKLEELQKFFDKHPEAGAADTAARKKAIRNIKYNIQWLKKNKVEVGNWLQKKVKGI